MRHIDTKKWTWTKDELVNKGPYYRGFWAQDLGLCALGNGGMFADVADITTKFDCEKRNQVTD